MIHITAQMRVLVAIEPVDGRKGIDTLARICPDKLSEDPFSGCVFFFLSRSAKSIRILTYAARLAGRCSRHRSRKAWDRRSTMRRRRR
jgi:transposase